MQAVRLTNTQILTDRVFHEGNLYPEDLNTVQDIYKSKFDKIFEACITPGIFSTTNPVSNAGPLSVSLSDSTTFQIEPGKAIFRSGYVFELLTATQIAFAVNVDELDLSYVLVVRMIPNVTMETRYNVATEIVEPIELGMAFEIQLLAMNEYQFLSNTDLDYTIVLGEFTKQTDITPSYIESTSPITTRPWFTWEDVTHRSLLGTGRASTNNPHGMSMMDLETLPGLSYWTQNGLVGVVSTYQNSNHYGDLVEISIPPLSIDTNVGGNAPATFTITNGAAHVLSVREGSGTFHNFKYDRINRVVTVYSNAIIAEPLTVKCLVIHAGTVTLQQGNEFILQIEGAIDFEYFVTDSGVLPSFQSQEFNTQALSGVSNRYDMYSDTYGVLVLDPIPVFQTNFYKLSNNAFSEVFLPQTGTLNLALGNFVVPASMSVVLKIEGKNGTETVTENLTVINTGTGANFTVPVTTDLKALQTTRYPGQWVPTVKSYTSITKISIDSSSSNMPTDTTILMTQSLANKANLIQLATILVTNRGTTSKVYDTRIQKIGVQKVSKDLFYEDFTNPVSFNPETSTFTVLEGIYSSIYQSRPIYFLKGSYLMEVNFNTLDSTNPPDVSISQYDSAGTLTLTPLTFDNNYSKMLYRFEVPNNKYQFLQISSPPDSGNRLASVAINFMTDTPLPAPPPSGSVPLPLTIGPEEVTYPLNVDFFNFNLSVSGGMGPYTYTLLNSDITNAVLNGEIISVPSVPASGLNGIVEVRVVDSSLPMSQSATRIIPVTIPAKAGGSGSGSLLTTTFVAPSYTSTATFNLQPTGGTSPYSIAVLSGGTIPYSDCAMNTYQLVISNIHNTGLQGTVNVKVTDFNGLSNIYLLDITVPAANYTIGITPLYVSSPVWSSTFSFLLNGVNGVGTYTYTTMPGGLASNAVNTGNSFTIHDIPTSGLNGLLHVFVADSNGVSSEIPISIVIPPVQNLLILPPADMVAAYPNTPGAHVLTDIGPFEILGGTGPYTIDVMLTGIADLPVPTIVYDSNVSMNSFTIGGTVTSGGTYNIKLQITSQENFVKISTFTIVANPV
jgi:hypothetical protein